MKGETDIREVQELLLSLLPQWNYRITKPFKHMLDEGVSLEMYNCIQTLRWLGGITTMSELGQWSQMPKQQMTKMVNRLVENNFVRRVYDPSDRRIIKIEITETALDYIKNFLDQNAKCFQNFLEQMELEKLTSFKTAIHTVHDILYSLPCERYCMISGEISLTDDENMPAGNGLPTP